MHPKRCKSLKKNGHLCNNVSRARTFRSLKPRNQRAMVLRQRAQTHLMVPRVPLRKSRKHDRHCGVVYLHCIPSPPPEICFRFFALCNTEDGMNKIQLWHFYTRSFSCHTARRQMLSLENRYLFALHYGSRLRWTQQLFVWGFMTEKETIICIY